MNQGRRSARRWGRLATATLTVTAGLGTASAPAATLNWDASGTHPTAPLDGSGTWNGGAAVWSNGTADVPWTDGSAANIGSGTGSAPYTIGLAANLSATSITFNNPGPGASYTVNGNGYAIALPSGNLNVNAATLGITGATVNVANGNLIDNGGAVTLTNATLTLGDASGNNPRPVVVENGGVLTLGPGSTLAVAVLSGDFSNSTVVFNGGTFRALANPYVNPAANQNVYTAISAFTADYVSTGGLTFDTSAIASGIAYVTDPFAHAPGVAGPDGGMTVTGGGTLQLGFGDENPPFNPVYSYNGSTAVTGNTTLRLDTLGGTSADVYGSGLPGTGPFPNTRFTVAAGSTLAAAATDAIAGETGTTPVTLNGGTLSLVNGASAHLATVTLNGGTLTADAATAAAGGRFTFLPSAQLHATANATVTSAALAFDAGATVAADAGVTLSISSPIVNGDAVAPLTSVGAGTVILSGVSTYTGATNVAAGTLSLTATASLSNTSSVFVASGATLLLNGTVGAKPTLSVNGTATVGPVPGATGRGVRAFGAIAIGPTGTVTLTPAASSATRTDLITPSLTLAAGGQLDLGNGDLDVSGGSLSALTAAAARGFASGTWAGPGLASAAAAADSRHLTAVGVIQNVAADGVTPLYGTFDGQSVTAADVLARYTYYGDANLDGVVNAADYSRIDAGYLMHLSGWANGDFNYDGVVDGSDYTLIDNSFNQQVGTVATPALARLARVSPTLAVATVPEPSPALAMLAAWASATALGRSRRRCRPGRGRPAMGGNSPFPLIRT